MSNFVYFPGPNPYLPPKKNASKIDIIVHFTSNQKKNQLNF